MRLLDGEPSILRDFFLRTPELNRIVFQPVSSEEIYKAVSRDTFRVLSSLTQITKTGSIAISEPRVKVKAPPPRRRQTSRVQPGDIPASAAAHRMGMNDDAFNVALPNLIARGFPKPDLDTGNFDLDAIDAWRRTRHPHLFAGRAEFGAMDASTVVKDRLAAASRGVR